MSPFRDYYLMLGVPREADEGEIKAAFRELALRFHPDINPNTADQQRFIEIREAYRVLSNPESRRSYNLRYDQAQGGTVKSSALPTAQEMTRFKRASRYNRSLYSQRVRYRGTTYVPGTEPAPPPRPQGGAARPRTTFSEAYFDTVMQQHESDLKGFRMFSGAMRWIAALILAFCAGMLADYGLAMPEGAERVEAKTPQPWAPAQPDLVKIRTRYSQFLIAADQADRLPEGLSVKIEKAFFSRIPLRVEFRTLEGRLVGLHTYGTRYGPGFWWVGVVMLISLATLLLRRNVEFNAYLGTFNLIFALMILAYLFKP